MKIKIPGKIFIGGEYAALKGFPALTVAVNPCFEFESNRSAANPFHPQSPAGLINKNIKGDFFDPYKNRGGMGRSTAEFLAATYSHNRKWEIWESYRNLLSCGEPAHRQTHRQTPSGVDLLTQITGGYCLTQTTEKSIKKSDWPFEKLDWVALVTGNKIKTHEHLAKPLSLDWALLEKFNFSVVESFQNAQEDHFIQSLNLWRQFLLNSQLEVPTTTELIEFFMDINGVKAAKGCGAMGSDVVLIIFEKNNSEQLEKSLESWDSDHLIRSSQVCQSGLEVLGENENLSTL